MKRLLTGVLIILMACINHPVFGGDLIPPGPPSGGSGMPTLLDIYNYLNSGTEPPTPEPFQEPLEGPSPTMKTTKEIYDVIGGKLDQLDATDEHVLEGKYYFDTREGYWGINYGSMVNRGAVIINPGAAAQELPEGYHNGSGKVSGDTDLVAGNIKNGVNIFGVTGRLVDASNATRVPKTGQTGCWDASGTVISPCTNTGQDGEYRLGVLPEVTPSVGISGSYTVYGWGGTRFTDNLDGTVTDNLTGLMWAKNADAEGDKTWAEALTYCNDLVLPASGYTDWRLPNINELHSLVDPTQSDPALPAGYSGYFTNVQLYGYWSSTTYESDPLYAWYVIMFDGYVYYVGKGSTLSVWPVRGGQ